MNDNIKQAYLDKMSAQLKEWGAKVEVVKAKFAQGGADMRIDYHKKIEDWQQKESVLKTKMEELRKAGVDGYESVKASVQNAWNEVNGLIDSLEENKNDSRK